MESFFSTLSQYCRFYGKFLQQQWRDISPAGYGTILICIAIFGWMLMKSSVKGPGS